MQVWLGFFGFLLTEFCVCSCMINGYCQHQKTSKAHCRIHNCVFHRAAHKSEGEIIGRINISLCLHKEVLKDAEQRGG